MLDDGETRGELLEPRFQQSQGEEDEKRRSTKRTRRQDGNTNDERVAACKLRTQYSGPRLRFVSRQQALDVTSSSNLIAAQAGC